MKSGDAGALLRQRRENRERAPGSDVRLRRGARDGGGLMAGSDFYAA